MCGCVLTCGQIISHCSRVSLLEKELAEQILPSCCRSTVLCTSTPPPNILPPHLLQTSSTHTPDIIPTTPLPPLHLLQRSTPSAPHCLDTSSQHLLYPHHLYLVTISSPHPLHVLLTSSSPRPGHPPTVVHGIRFFQGNGPIHDQGQKSDVFCLTVSLLLSPIRTRHYHCCIVDVN